MCIITVSNNMTAESQQESLRVSQTNKVNNSQSTHSGDFCISKIQKWGEGLSLLLWFEGSSTLTCFAHMKGNAKGAKCKFRGKCHFTSNSEHKIRCF